MNKHVNPRGFKTGDSFKQVRAFDNARLAEAKSLLCKKAFTSVESLLQKDFGATKTLLVEENLVEVSPNTFSGNIKANISIETAKGTKVVPFNITVEKSEIVVKNAEHISIRVNEQLKNIKGSLEKKMEKYENSMKERVAAIDQRAAEDVEINKLIAEGKSLDDASNMVRGKVIKNAAEYVMGDGAVIDSIWATIPEHISYNKQLLPSTLKIGDTININGIRYEITGSDPALSSGKSDGSRWHLDLKHTK